MRLQNEATANSCNQLERSFIRKTMFYGKIKTKMMSLTRSYINTAAAAAAAAAAAVTYL